jgi:hypothetical protein
MSEQDEEQSGMHRTQRSYKVGNDTEYTLTPMVAEHTISKVQYWDVDCWVTDDSEDGGWRNHWHRSYSDYDKAKAEFERWRPK